MHELATALFAPDRWPTFVLVSARVGGLMTIAPLWSMTAMPPPVRAAITVVLSALLAAGAPAAAMPAEGLDAVLPIGADFAVGIGIGLAAAVIVNGAVLAGEVLALQTGLSLGPALAPMPELQGSPLGQILGLLAIALFTATNGHLAMVHGLADSLRVLPPGCPLDLARGWEAMGPLVGSTFACGVQVAAPVLATLLLVQVAMALLGRAVPQLNALMTAFPVTIGVGLLALGLSLPLIASSLEGSFAGVPARTSYVIGALAPAPGSR